MDETVGEMDSIMISFLRSAMDYAYKNVHSKASQIECLNETSKFYELAIILINGGLELIKQEPDDDRIPETSCQKTLPDLIELQDLLRERLNHTKCLIIEKDKELIERLENEFRLRQDLESKDRELVCLRSKLEFERSKNEKIQEFILSQLRMNISKGKEKDFLELKNSVGFDPESKEKIEVSPNTIVSLDDRLRPDNRSQNLMIKQMSTDINLLKGILDLVFGQTHNVNNRRSEKQWGWSIEEETILITIKGFIQDLKSSSECHTCSKMIDEMVVIRDKLQTVLRIRNEAEDSNKIEKKFRGVIARLDTFINCKNKPEEETGVVVQKKQHSLRKHSEERHKSSLQTMAMEEHYMLLVNNCYKEFLAYDIETNIREDVFAYVLREVAKEWSAHDENESLKSRLTDEIYKSVFVETINDIMINVGFELQKIQNEINECHMKNTIKEDLYAVFFQELVEDLNIEKHLHELEISFVHDVYQSVIDGFKESRFFMSKNTNLSEQIEGELMNQRQSFEDQSTLSFVNHKPEKATRTLSASQERLRELDYGLATEPSDLHSTEDMVYTFLTDFQEYVCEKLYTNFARLERITQRVDSLSGLAASVRKNELVYKKAFARRCQNLVLAETEVDLLGDQVEALQELLGKIYFVLIQNTSLLTNNFEVMDILKSIQKELSC